MIALIALILFCCLAAAYFAHAIINREPAPEPELPILEAEDWPWPDFDDYQTK